MPEYPEDDNVCAVRFTLNPGRLLRVLLIAVSVMALVGLAVHLYLFLSGGPDSATLGSTLTRFGINYERSVPTWFSAVLLLAGSGTLWLCYRQERAPDRSSHRFWAGLALLLLAMSIDEIAGFHENFHYIITRRTGFQGSGVLRYCWVLVGIPFVAAVTLVSIPFLRRLRRRTAVLLVVAGAVYFGGAVGLEMVSSYFRDLYAGDKSVAFYIVTAFEEYFEMVGASLLIYAALDYCRSEQTAGAIQGTRAASDPSGLAHAQVPRQ